MNVTLISHTPEAELLLLLFTKATTQIAEIEAFAAREFGGDLLKKGALLKIVDKMRKGS